MSDFLIEVIDHSVDISIGDSETPTINLEIVNTEKILLSDLPDIEISKILGLLEYVQDVIGLSGVVGGSGVSVSYNDTTGLTTINVSTGIPITNLVSSGITLGNTTVNLGQTSFVLDGLTRISGVSSGNPVYLYNAYIDGGTP